MFLLLQDLFRSGVSDAMLSYHRHQLRWLKITELYFVEVGSLKLNLIRIKKTFKSNVCNLAQHGYVNEIIINGMFAVNH